MDNMNMKKMGEFYKQYLLNNVIPFWQNYGVDWKNGGFFTCLDRNGEIYSTDKSVWFQGRGTWIFSKLYNTIKANPQYLAVAKNGYEFLKKCYDRDGRMFFLVTHDALPIQKRRYYFSETFAAIACAEYYTASGDSEALALSRATFDLIEKLYRNPHLNSSKYYVENFNVKALSIPMILLSTAQVLRNHDREREQYYNDFITKMIHEILNGGYYNEERRALFEYASLDRSHINGPKGRLVNPGHSIETSWFIAIEALRRKEDLLLEKALNILNWSLDLGWDKQYDGLLYFVDIEGKPTEQLESDMKLWWPHTEALYATALAWKFTGKEFYKAWFEKLHEYSFSNFIDVQYGEWFGYLHRDGSLSSSLKGSIYKGPFHLPRALMLLCELLL